MSNGVAGDHEQLLRQQTILAQFGELALRSDELDEILTEACRLVGEALGTDFAKVVELQEDGKTLLVRAGVGWKAGVVGVATIEIRDDTSEGYALKTGEPMISPDIEKETRFKYPPFLIDNGAKAVANVIIIGGKDRPPFGILQVDSRRPREFTCALKPKCTPDKLKRFRRWKHEGVMDQMQARLDHMPDAMSIRRQTVEHPFGTLKSWMGSTHFLTKTLQKVRTEMSLHVLAYNLKRMIQILGVRPLIQAIRA